MSTGTASPSASLPRQQMLRVGVFDQSSAYSSQYPGYPLDAPNQAVNINFPIAALHFNGRRADLVPILGTPLMQKCPLNISIPIFCDDSGNSLLAINDLFSASGMFDALVGFGSSTDLYTTAQVASVMDLPIVNHWCSSPSLIDKSLFKMLARTGQDDAVLVFPIIKLLGQLGYSKAVLLFVSGAAGPSFSALLKSTAFEYGLDILGIAYDSGRPASIELACSQIAGSGLNVVIVYGYAADYILGSLPQTAAAHGLVSSTMWIWTNFDRAPTAAELDANPSLYALFRGSLMLDRVIPSSLSAPFARYQRLWTTEFAGDTSFINRIFPPHGLVQHQCLRDSLNYQITPQIFNATIDSVSSVWAFAYDAVMSLGVAACTLVGNGSSFHNGTLLYDALMQVDFMSLSGQVRFDPATGDRLSDAAITTISNVRFTASSTGDGGQANFVQVGRFVVPPTANNNLSYGEWVIDSAIQWVTGPSGQPPELVMLPQNYNYLSEGLVDFGYFVIALVNFVCLVLALWLHVNRRKRVVVQAQPFFMHSILVGVAVSSWSVLGITVDDNPFRLQIMSPEVGCNFFFCVYLTGYAFALAMLFGKLFRVFTVFNSDFNGLRLGVSVNFILAGVLLFMCLQFLFIGLWQGLAPMEWQRTVTARTPLGAPLASFGSCTPASPNSVGLLSALIIIQIASLVAVLIMGVRVKRIPLELREAFFVSLAAFAALQTDLLGIPIVVALVDSVPGRFVTLALIVLFTDLVLALVLVLPKMARDALGGPQDGVEEEPPPHKGSGPAVTVKVEEGLCIPRIRNRFLHFCDRRMVIENAHFISDVQLWSERFDDTPPAQRNGEARAMVKIYILEGSLLEVNLSSEIRAKVMANIHAEHVPKDAFELAFREICYLLNQNAWLQFCEQGGLYGVSELGLADKSSPNVSNNNVLTKSPVKQESRRISTSSVAGGPLGSNASLSEHGSSSALLQSSSRLGGSPASPNSTKPPVRAADAPADVILV